MRNYISMQIIILRISIFELFKGKASLNYHANQVDLRKKNKRISSPSLEPAATYTPQEAKSTVSYGNEWRFLGSMGRPLFIRRENCSSTA